MRLSLRVRAELDVTEAYGWYESRGRGLGDEFLVALEDCLARVRRQPILHAAHDDRVRRARVRRFPYWVYFVIRGEIVDVLAVFHERRRPRRFEE